MAGWSSTINDILSVMFEYFLKPEELGACGATKKCNFKSKEKCTCVECQSTSSKDRQKLSTGKGFLGSSQFLHPKETARTIGGRKDILYIITFSTRKDIWAVEVV